MEMSYYRHELRNYLTIDNVYSVFYNNMVNNYSAPGETHDFYELVYVDSGDVIFEVDAQDERMVFKLEQGYCYLHAPNRYHRHFVTGRMKGTACIISFDCDHKILSGMEERVMLLSRRQKEYLAAVMSYASRMFKGILDTNKDFMFFKFEEYDCLLEQMFRNTLELMFLDMLIADNNQARLESSYLKNGSSERIVDEVKSYLKASIYDKIKITDLCQHFSYGKTALSNKFKAVTGISIIQYFNQMKIEEAVELLENTHLTITDIAFRLNFSSCQYFSRVFKNFLGIYPRDFKKSITKKENIKFFKCAQSNQTKKSLQFYNIKMDEQ